eukprot:362638-Chlamydomonas_euryale.AAC.4
MCQASGINGAPQRESGLRGARTVRLAPFGSHNWELSDSKSAQKRVNRGRFLAPMEQVPGVVVLDTARLANSIRCFRPLQPRRVPQHQLYKNSTPGLRTPCL